MWIKILKIKIYVTCASPFQDTFAANKVISGSGLTYIKYGEGEGREGHLTLAPIYFYRFLVRRRIVLVEHA